MSPDPGGFSSVDTENPQSWNRYAYVGNDPLRNTDPTGLCMGGSSCGSDEGSSTEGGGWVAMETEDLGALLSQTQVGMPFGQGVSFTIDGFEASPEEAMMLMEAGAGQPGNNAKSVTVPENVIYDQDANGGQGLTKDQKTKFNEMQRKAEEFYAKTGIQFKVTFSEGHIVFSTGGTILEVIGKEQGKLNVFVMSGKLPLTLNGFEGKGSEASAIGSIGGHKYAFVFLGLGVADAHSLEHGMAHHFIGNTLGQNGFLKNLFIDFYIDHIVLPHVGSYGDTMRGYAQKITELP